MGPLGEVHVHMGDQLLHNVFIHVCDRSFVQTRDSSSFGLGSSREAYWRMPSEPWAENKDSCCHQIGMSLIDECTVLEKPLHGWIESDLWHLVRGTRVHRSMTVVKIVHLLATGFRQVTPSSPGCWSQQSRISAPNSSWGHTSTARHESCCRNGQRRRRSAPASEELAKGSFRQL